MANDKLIKSIFDDDGGKELLLYFAEHLETDYDRLDNKDNDRDTDMYLKGRIAAYKDFLTDMQQIKKIEY